MLRRSLRLFRPRFLFRFSEQPKGFEKFQRKKQNKNDQQQNDTKQDQNIEKEEDKKQPDLEQEKQEKQESNQEINQDFKKDQKKKFIYNPSHFEKQEFKHNKEEKDKNEQKNEQQEEEKEQKQDNDKENLNEKKQKQKKEKIDWRQKFKENWEDPQKKLGLIGLFGLGSILGVAYILNQDNSISYLDFWKEYFEQDKIIKIIIFKQTTVSRTNSVIHLKTGESVNLILGNVDHFLETLEKAQYQKGYTSDIFIPIEFKEGIDKSKFVDRAINLVYLGASVLIAYTLLKQLKVTISQSGKGGGGDFFGFGKANVKKIGFEENTKVKFDDVAGLGEAKTEIKEFVDFLKQSKRYKDIGAKIPRGALLSGPPGTGKTMLAKACAGEAGVPFYFVSGSDFVEMFVGVGASRVRDLFKQAKESSPSIIFIDEIDAVGRKRDVKIGSNDERDNTLNQLLVEMDGFGTDSDIVILAATNRAELLDPALTRPGRLDRIIDITLPDIQGRTEIFKVHLSPLKLDPTQPLEEYARRLATLTPGFSGAEIANLANEAAILAARQNKKSIEPIDFEMAAERVMAGLEKKTLISKEEKKTVAYHESGHAVISWFLEGGHPLLKVTIIPRSKGSLGYAQYLPNESTLETREELMDRICCILGGRCAEKYFFNRITTGAQDDLQKAYQIAYGIVARFGMSAELVNVQLEGGEYKKLHSDKTSKLRQIVDNEIRKIIDECTERTHKLIEQYEKEIEKLATALIEKETLDLKNLIQILGQRPFEAKSNYRAYLEQNAQSDV